MNDPIPTTTWQPHVPPNWKLRARLWIGALLVLLASADYLLLRFSYDPFNPLPLLSGLAVLGALGSKVLLVAMWLRKPWARYALGTLLVLSITGFSIVLFYITGGNLPRPQGLLKKPVVGIALQALALVPLARSRSIRKQLHPMTGRD